MLFRSRRLDDGDTPLCFGISFSNKRTLGIPGSAVSVCAERFQNDVQTDHFGPGVDIVKPAFDNGDVQSDLWQNRRNIHRWDACISVLYGRQYSVELFFKLLKCGIEYLYW